MISKDGKKYHYEVVSILEKNGIKKLLTEQSSSDHPLISISQAAFRNRTIEHF